MVQPRCPGGVIEAYRCLGLMYEYGKGVRQNPVKAAELYRIAAEHGVAYAQLELASLYRIGKGVQQDYLEAARWFRRAAEQGNPTGENALGCMYFHGEGVARDYRQAAYWLRKAAEQDDVQAQSNLGVLYGKGLGVPLDYAEAYKWFALTANKGGNIGAASTRALNTLKGLMTARQLRDGRARVSEWISRRNNTNLAAQTPEPRAPDSYATTARP